jgi:hypothetical protein
MAAIAFDTLKAARRMIAAGMPQRQAEAQAEIMAEAFVFNVDSLVTKDYLESCLDARFLAQDARFEKMLDSRFAQMGARFAQIDARFAEVEARFAGQGERFTDQESRFTQLEAKMDLGFSEANGKFKLIYWMLAVVIASTTVPALHTLVLG